MGCGAPAAAFAGEDGKKGAAPPFGANGGAATGGMKPTDSDCWLLFGPFDLDMPPATRSLITPRIFEAESTESPDGSSANSADRLR